MCWKNLLRLKVGDEVCVKVDQGVPLLKGRQLDQVQKLLGQLMPELFVIVVLCQIEQTLNSVSLKSFLTELKCVRTKVTET